MADYRLKMGDTLDIDIALNGGSADSGVTYRMGGNDVRVATINTAGVVTPVAPGLAVVEALNSSNTVVRRFTVQVVSAAEAAVHETGNVDVELSGSNLPVVRPELELE